MSIIPGIYTIIPLNEGTPYPLGVNHTLLRSQNVRVNAPVRKWRVSLVDRDTYNLSVGGYPYTGVSNDVKDKIVIASIQPEQNVNWKLSLGQKNAYTITRADGDRSLGWTVQNNLGEGDDVALRGVIQMPSEPPQFLPTQLFRFEPAGE